MLPLGIRNKIFISTTLLVLVVAVAVAAAAIFQLGALRQDIAAQGEQSIRDVNAHTGQLLEDTNREVASLLAHDMLDWIDDLLLNCELAVDGAARYMEGLYQKPPRPGGAEMQAAALPGADGALLAAEYAQIADMADYLAAQPLDKWGQGVEMYIVTEAGLFFYGGELEDGFDTDLRQRAWYSRAKETGDAFWTDIYVDSVSGANIISYCRPVYREGRVVAVAGIDVPVQVLVEYILWPETDLISDACVLQSGLQTAYGLNQTPALGEFVSNNGGLLAGFFTPAGEYRLEIIQDGENSMVAFVRIGGHGWAVMVYTHFSGVRDTAALINGVVESSNHSQLAAIDRTITRNIWLYVAIDVVILAAGLLVARRNTKRAVRPIESLVAMAKQVGEGNLDAHFEDIRSGDEAERIAHAFNDMVVSLKAYMANLERVTADKKRVETELDIATRIQRSMLPTIFPPFPDRAEFDIRASMEPAREVGGDFYDFFMVDEDHLAVVAADVSGKGVGAALFMVIAKTLIKNGAQTGLAPAGVFTRVNGQLCQGNGEGMFVTAFLGVLEISTGRLTWTNAGHPFPVLLSGAEAAPITGPKKAALASWEGIEYPEATLQMRPGQRLFLYTDGVTEAHNAAYEEFGKERMCRALAAMQREKAGLAPLISGLRAEIDAFAGAVEQADDITMLALEYRGGQSEGTPT